MKIIDVTTQPPPEANDTTPLSVKEALQLPSPDIGRPRIVRLVTIDELQELQDNLGEIEAIDVHFPVFNHGAGFSIARLLRQRHDWQGWLVASGDLRVDQMECLKRCGFNAVVLKSGQSLAEARRQQQIFNRRYQRDEISGRYWLGDIRFARPIGESLTKDS